MSSNINGARASRTKKSSVHTTIRPQSNSATRITKKKNTEPLRHIAINNINSSNKNKTTSISSNLEIEDQESEDGMDSGDNSESEIQSSSGGGNENLPNLDEVAVFVRTEKSNDIYKCLKCNKVWYLYYNFVVVAQWVR